MKINKFELEGVFVPYQDNDKLLPGDVYEISNDPIILKQYQPTLKMWVELVKLTRNGETFYSQFPITSLVNKLHREREYEMCIILKTKQFGAREIVEYIAGKTITIQEDGTPFTYYYPKAGL